LSSKRECGILEVQANFGVNLGSRYTEVRERF